MDEISIFQNTSWKVKVIVYFTFQHIILPTFEIINKLWEIQTHSVYTYIELQVSYSVVE